MEMKPVGGPKPLYPPAFGLRDRLLAELSQATPQATPTSLDGGTQALDAGVEPRVPPPAPLPDVVVNGCAAAKSWIKQELDYAARGSSPFNQLKQQIRQYRLDCAADHMQKYIDDIQSRGSPYDPDSHFNLGVDTNDWLVDDEPARLRAVGYKGYVDDDLRGGAYSAPE